MLGLRRCASRMASKRTTLTLETLSMAQTDKKATEALLNALQAIHDECRTTIANHLTRLGAAINLCLNGNRSNIGVNVSPKERGAKLEAIRRVEADRYRLGIPFRKRMTNEAERDRRALPHLGG